MLGLGECGLDDVAAAPIFANGAHLRVLNLNYNRLTTIPASVHGLVRLEELYLSHNDLVTVDAGILSLEGTLRQITLDGNSGTLEQQLVFRYVDIRPGAPDFPYEFFRCFREWHRRRTLLMCLRRRECSRSRGRRRRSRLLPVDASSDLLLRVEALPNGIWRHVLKFL